MNWGAELAREPGVAVPPATAPACLALVDDANAAARYLATHGRKIRGATMAENEAMRFALPVTPGVEAVRGPLPPGWRLPPWVHPAPANLRAADVHIEGAYGPAGPYVDIYLSAAPYSGAGSCDTDDESACKIYRVRWDLGGWRAVEVERVSEEGVSGEVQAALSPDETRLAWVRKVYGDAGGAERSIRVREQGGGGSEAVSTASRAEFPAWASDRTLVYTASGERGEYCGTDRVNHMSTLWASGEAGSAPLAGPGSVSVGTWGTSFQDGHVHRAPAYRSDGAPRIVTFGGQGFCEKVPAVTDLLGGEREEFDLSDWGDAASCQHPAWNIDGTAVLCTRHAEQEYPDGENTPWLRQWYAFASPGACASSSWGDPVPLLRGLDEATLLENFPYVFRPLGSGGGYTFKYAEWCGTNDYVVSTLFAMSGDGDVMASRVVIAKNSAAGARFGDLVEVVERAFGGGDAAVGAWRGMYSTCSAARSGADWTPCSA